MEVIRERGGILWAHFGRGVRRPAPGKLRAIEKWELPKTVTALRAFLGFTNFYSSYVRDYARVVTRLMEKLKVPPGHWQKGPHNQNLLGTGGYSGF